MNQLPSPKECIDILEKCGCSDSVIRHCKAVRNLAVVIAEKVGADIELIEAGSLLHDIGRSKTHGIFHAVEGVKIAKKLDLSENIIKIIERHIGAGISKKVAKELGLPEKDYIPITIAEKIVCHADNLIDNCKRQNIEKEVERAKKEGHKEYAEHLMSLHNELSNLCGVNLNQI